jgi:hypothetical protein
VAVFSANNTPVTRRMIMSKTRRFENIREAIRNQERLSREARSAIRATSGLDRYNAWAEKRSIGAHTRDLLLAYAFLRGVPYRVCEPVTQGGFPAYGLDIYRRLVEFGYREKVERLYKCPPELQEWLDSPAVKAEQVVTEGLTT